MYLIRQVDGQFVDDAYRLPPCAFNAEYEVPKSTETKGGRFCGRIYIMLGLEHTFDTNPLCIARLCPDNRRRYGVVGVVMRQW